VRSAGDKATLGLFLAALAWTLAAPWCQGDQASVSEAQTAAAEAQRAGPAPPLVIVHPPWRDDVERALRAQGLPATIAFTKRSTDPVPTGWVVADARWPLPAWLRRSPKERLAGHGAAVVWRLLPSGPTPALATTLVLADATVTLHKADGTTRPCPWDPKAQHHRCTGEPPWMYVGEETVPIEGKETTCVWLHPQTNARLEVAFAPLPRTGVGRVVLGAALSDTAADNPQGAPVHVAVQVEHRRTALTLHRARGFQQGALEMPTGPTPAEIRIEATTPHDGQRHTCFRLHLEAAP
jgi:hypothetical protein